MDSSDGIGTFWQDWTAFPGPGWRQTRPRQQQQRNNNETTIEKEQQGFIPCCLVCSAKLINKITPTHHQESGGWSLHCSSRLELPCCGVLGGQGIKTHHSRRRALSWLHWTSASTAEQPCHQPGLSKEVPLLAVGLELYLVRFSNINSKENK